MLLLPSRLWKKCRRKCRRLKMNEEKRKLDGMESSKSKRNAHCMYGHEMTSTSQTWATMWCANHDDKNLTTGLCAHGITRASFTCWVPCALCGRCSGSWWSRCHWCRASCRSVSPRVRNTKYRVLSFWILLSNYALVVRLYSVIVNFICSQIIAHFCIATTGHLRCYLYTHRRLQ